MKLASKIGAAILFIIGAILLILGFLFILGAFSPDGSPSWLGIGVVIVAFGIAMIIGGIILVYLNSRREKASAPANVTYNIDLPGNVSLDTLKCKSCGGTLSKDNIEMVAGAPVVSCPFCNTSYQLTEEPKW
jgi:hypothetical protein